LTRHFSVFGILEEGVPMAHIAFPDGVPGIRGVLVSRPAMDKPKGGLVWSTPIS
jgi:hypothetical protein